MENNENNALISVIIPLYNAEDYLERCVDSVLEQTYNNIEVILVDDGSTDGSGEICDSYAAEDDRVRVLHQENGKQAAARNAGIREAKGDYITFSDSDDEMHPEKLEKMYNMLTETDADVVVCSFTYKDEQGRVLPWEVPHYTGDSPLSSRDALVQFLTTKNIEGFFWNKLIRADLLKANEHTFDTQKEAYEDVVPAFRVLEQAELVSFVPDALQSYYQHDDSNTNAPDSGRLAIYVDTISEIRDLAKEMGLEQEGIYYYTSRVIQAAYQAHRRRDLYTTEDYADLEKLFTWERLFGNRSVGEVYRDATFFTGDFMSRLKLRVKLFLNRRSYD